MLITRRYLYCFWPWTRRKRSRYSDQESPAFLSSRIFCELAVLENAQDRKCKKLLVQGFDISRFKISIHCKTTSYQYEKIYVSIGIQKRAYTSIATIDYVLPQIWEITREWRIKREWRFRREWRTDFLKRIELKLYCT